MEETFEIQKVTPSKQGNLEDILEEDLDKIKAFLVLVKDLELAESKYPSCSLMGRDTMTPNYIVTLRTSTRSINEDPNVVYSEGSQTLYSNRNVKIIPMDF